MLEVLAVRVYAARRAALESRLTGSGMAEDVAAQWLAAYEAHAAETGLDRGGRDFWAQGWDWISAERAHGRCSAQPVRRDTLLRTVRFGLFIVAGTLVIIVVTCCWTR